MKIINDKSNGLINSRPETPLFSWHKAVLFDIDLSCEVDIFYLCLKRLFIITRQIRELAVTIGLKEYYLKGQGSNENLGDKVITIFISYSYFQPIKVCD